MTQTKRPKLDTLAASKRAQRRGRIVPVGAAGLLLLVGVLGASWFQLQSRQTIVSRGDPQSGLRIHYTLSKRWAADVDLAPVLYRSPQRTDIEMRFFKPREPGEMQEWLRAHLLRTPPDTSEWSFFSFRAPAPRHLAYHNGIVDAKCNGQTHFQVNGYPATRYLYVWRDPRGIGELLDFGVIVLDRNAPTWFQLQGTADVSERSAIESELNAICRSLRVEVGPAVPLPLSPRQELEQRREHP